MLICGKCRKVMIFDKNDRYYHCSCGNKLRLT